ncbi:hypothetical protein SO802_023255 [Lithocarpus litseifolius]|uniref:Uncharacterized protein n=1 Tax=Lithocarpus litseifolius TaxID=425828 RepID=A0AAW2C676_9ROSI
MRTMEESTGAVSSVALDNWELTQAHRNMLFNSENIYQFRMTFVGVEMMWRAWQVMPLSLAKEIFMKWTTWMIVVDARIGRKCQLALIYVGQKSSHSRQRVEAADEEAHIFEEARLVASDDDETQAPDDYVQTPASVQNPAPVQNLASENRRARRGKTKLANIWAMTGEYKIQLPLNDEGQPIGKDGSLFVWWLGTFCENGLLCRLMPAR